MDDVESRWQQYRTVRVNVDIPQILKAVVPPRLLRLLRPRRLFLAGMVVATGSLLIAVSGLYFFIRSNAAPDDLGLSIPGQIQDLSRSSAIELGSPAHALLSDEAYGLGGPQLPGGDEIGADGVRHAGPLLIPEGRSGREAVQAATFESGERRQQGAWLTGTIE